MTLAYIIECFKNKIIKINVVNTSNIVETRIYISFIKQ